MPNSDVNTDIFVPQTNSGYEGSPENIELTQTAELVVPAQADEPIDSIAYFFAVGLLVNLLLIAAYFIWAYRQWNKESSEDSS